MKSRLSVGYTPLFPTYVASIGTMRHLPNHARPIKARMVAGRNSESASPSPTPLPVYTRSGRTRRAPVSSARHPRADRYPAPWHHRWSSAAYRSAHGCGADHPGARLVLADLVYARCRAGKEEADPLLRPATVFALIEILLLDRSF